MAKQQGHYPNASLGDSNEISGSGSARRFLKSLDRQLVRFSGKISALEERANRLSSEEGDLLVTLEELHRETLLLRAEIREHLAAGKRRSAEMMEYAEESWEQLKETLAELKESLGPKKSSGSAPAKRVLEDDSSEGEEDEWFAGDWEDEDTTGLRSEIHPPRVGPRR
jgi:chromosome segregation ATPase